MADQAEADLTARQPRFACPASHFLEAAQSRSTSESSGSAHRVESARTFCVSAGGVTFSECIGTARTSSSVVNSREVRAMNIRNALLRKLHACRNALLALSVFAVSMSALAQPASANYGGLWWAAPAG